VKQCHETYQTILTMFSLSRQPEKSHESSGVPWRALLGSLALHALALGMLAGLPSAEPAGVPPAVPLRADLRAVPEAVAVAAEAVPRAARAPQRRAALSASAPAAANAVPPAPSLVAAPAVVPSEPAGGIAVARSAPEPVTVAMATLGERGPDAAGLRQYRLALAGEARRFRSYPETARRAGMAGTAEVRVSVAAGAPRQTELARSSGHAILDTAALDMLRAAAARTTLPESLRGQEFAVLLPVVFEVED
jgi:protein TonB